MFTYQPPEPERTIAVRRAPGQTLTLDRTVSHLYKGGVPADPIALRSLKNRFTDGTYKKNRAQLLKDLKSDPGLFIHYLRHIYTSGIDPEVHPDPVAALAVLEDEKLEKLFEVEASDISVHQISAITKTQALRLQHSMLSAHSAEALATKNSVAPGLAYSSAMLRQLALNLIAWNYPTIFSRALNAHRTRKVDILDELQKQLGTSPLQIVSRIIADWNLGSELRRSSQPEQFRRQEGETLEEADGKLNIQQICEISELYAKSHDRANYPEAEKQWRDVEPKLRERFGETFLENIEEEILASLSHYERSAPKVFCAPLFAKAAVNIGERGSNGNTVSRNSFALRCPEELYNSFSDAYEQLKLGEVSVEAVRHLVDVTVPLAGFQRGCLYLASKDGTKLRPTLRVGDMPLSLYSEVGHREQSPVVDCLITTVPIRWVGEGIRGAEVEIIAGSLGALRHPGVLYLELSRVLSLELSEEVLLYFHAIRKAFLDFLADGGE